jgi:bifunctional DNA-binding transcriptional regulator/antitoxin component of YhaV-PrlF toxin-antitoxin module
MTKSVKNRRRPKATTRVSSKHQVTIPRAPFSEAGLRPGERLDVRAAGPGRVVLSRAESATERHAATLTGVFPAGALDELRDEWD